MFPTDPQLMKAPYPVERSEALRRAGHLRAATGKSKPRGRLPRARRIFRRRRSPASVGSSPPGAGGRLLHL